MNGKVVAVSEEGAIVVIEEEVTAIFENMERQKVKWNHLLQHQKAK